MYPQYCYPEEPSSRSGTFLCPRLPLGGVGHIVFCHDVTSVRAYVRMSRS